MSEGASASQPQHKEASSGQSTWQRVQAQLRGSTLVPLLVLGAAVLAVVVVLLLWAQSPDYRVLYSNLEEADGGQVINELQTRGVPYQISEGGRAILVPSDQVHQLRLQLAEQGLPRGGNLGFELMDNQAFGISQFAEQVNFQRSLEGELTRSIESLGPVMRARVHLSMARQSVFVREREAAKASVVVHLQPGRQLGEGQVDAIVHMVASSVPELAAENVTVVDEGGRLLSRQGGAGDDVVDGSRLSYVREIERAYQERIERILVPIYGRQNVKAQVTAEVDFTRREETSERYAPNQEPGSASVRSLQDSRDLAGDEAWVGGVPGALSNTPPGAAASPIELPGTEENEAEPGEGEVQGETQEKTTGLTRFNQNRIVNYEVDRTIAHVTHQFGEVERLSVAVVVNYREVPGEEDGDSEVVPLPTEELDQVQRLVRQAMGFSPARGDQLEVVNSPFVLDESAQPLAWWETAEVYHLLMRLARYLLVILAAVLLYWLLLRPLLKRHLARSETVQRGSRVNVTVGEDDAEMDDDGESSQAAQAAASEEARREEEAARRAARERRRRASPYAEQLEELHHLVADDPRLVAMVLRSWLKKDEHEEPDHDQPQR
ncbi:flagellar basal-body MS-ring/collar protein FliF [Halomonas marinisediminis]|uniref:Flagellar M-ring protein n=1 Tax=Halomonas marinisediminis TaxID=2546095 RepID=A0ABY2D5G8_9GAMM|nr:flagellar basal-body MS-ring/collar protein FliF [Halomonas marinisediminis]TDB01939.1 flagellar basal body M-ring protein FliF [Halomonas marinisediminis]